MVLLVFFSPVKKTDPRDVEENRKTGIQNPHEEVVYHFDEV